MTYKLDSSFKSQIKQDLWVLNKICYKQTGFYVDIGAFDGIELSNTYVMSQMGWSGICVECNPYIIQKLIENRASDKCKICTNPIWRADGKVLDFHSNEMLSFTTEKDGISDSRSLPTVSISLNTLLEKYQAPKNIDYISLDVEGVEFDILNSFDFNKWNVKCWTIEHNLQNTQESFQNFVDIAMLLLKHNYLIKRHDWDIFAIKDDFHPEYIVDGVRVK